MLETLNFKLNGEEKRKEIDDLCKNLDLDIKVTQMKLVIS